jgi:hypothetical protein
MADSGREAVAKMTSGHFDKAAKPLICNSANKARNVGMAFEII